MSRFSAARRGITLVEVLVVLTIIALASLLLMPSLSQSRVGSKDALCMSNLRQHLTALGNYATDNNAAMPAYEAMCSDEVPFHIQSLWDESSNTPNTALYRDDYLPRHQSRQLQCPHFRHYAGSAMPPGDMLHPDWNMRRYSYMYLANLPHDATTPQHPLWDGDMWIRYRAPAGMGKQQPPSPLFSDAPASTMVLSDIVAFDGTTADWAAGNALWINHTHGGVVFPNFTLTGGTSQAEVYDTLRQSCRSCNVAYLDGTVRTKKAAASLPPAAGADNYAPDQHYALNYAAYPVGGSWYFFW